jgi:hypothetical protein
MKKMEAITIIKIKKNPRTKNQNPNTEIFA